MYFYDDGDEEESAVEETPMYDVDTTDEVEGGGTEGSSSITPSSSDVIDSLKNKRSEDKPPESQDQSGDGVKKKGEENNTDVSKDGSGNDTKNSAKEGEKGANIPKNETPETDKTPKDNKSNGKSDLINAGLKGLQEDGGKGAAKEVAKEATKQAIKKEIKKQIAKRGLEAALQSLAGVLAPILFWVAVIILIIVIVVGIIMFIVATPGQIVAKAKSLASNVVKAWTAMIEGEDQMVSTTQLASVANYIESMGYDLKGEGFVTSDKKDTDISQTITDLTNIFSEGYDDTSDLKDKSGEELNQLLYVDNKQGVIRRNDTSDVVDLNSEPILSYIISDNQCYIIRNFNTSLNEMTDGNGSLLGDILAGLGALLGLIVLFLTPVGWIGALLATAAFYGGSYLAVKLNNNPDYGKGLISIYHEADETIGKKGDYYEVKEKGYIALDAASKQLKIKRGWANGVYTFNVDGWSGRYGMPLEFLLSVHLATQMPDLATEIATSFDTRVEVLLHPVNGEMLAGVLKQNPDGTWHEPSCDDNFITWERVVELGEAEAGLGAEIWAGFKGFINGLIGGLTGESPWKSEEFQALGINDKVLCILFEEGLPHSNSCTCCTHIPGSRYSPEEESCTSDTDLYNDDGDCINDHNICDECEDRALDIIAALAIVNDKEWESYTPYISKVTDHWFRDVYFVMNESENEFQSVIEVDEDYFYETEERWTLYEVWKEGDEGIPEGFVAGDYKLYDSKTGILSTKSKAEVQEINEKIALGDTTLTRLVKKAITQDLAPNSGEDWSAYELTGEDNVLPWTQISLSQDSDKDELTNDSVYKDEDASTPEDILIYYKEGRPADIKQIEDGQRTQTNQKIKDMFLNKKYYKFDGSIDRADAIIADRFKDGNNVANYNTGSDSRDPKLISKVNINKDSLAAFSILENTHTLDADYIYRDFKELIVELNYFDKEDLSDKVETVMQWIIPECGSAGWPVRRFEKGETFYGTLINSKEDLAYMREQEQKRAEEILGGLAPEEPGEETEEPSETPEGETMNTSVQAFLKAADDVHAYMDSRGTGSNGGNWDYCIQSSSDEHPNNQPCRACSDTVTEAANSGNYISNCSRYMRWVFQQLGLDVQASAQAIYNWCVANGWMPINSLDDMQPGDLLFNSPDGASGTENIGHVQLLGEGGIWYNAGSTNAINSIPYEWTATNFIIAMRPNMIGAAKLFEGYEPDQAVVAPVTGKIVDSGTVKRTNIETGEIEEVGYIKIQALDHYITSSKGKNVENECNTEDTEFDMENGNKKEGYDYFYEEYRGVLDGCVIYIEGFDLTLDDTLANSDYTSEDVSQYKTNVVYNMTNNLKEAQALWREDAKAAALPYFEEGGVTYIKEGTVIGKTREDADVEEGAKGNGNYIRLILRDLEDSIMEDVESYFDIEEDARLLEDQTYQQQEGDIELLARVLQAEGCSGFFHARGLDESAADDASRATGYVLINRALNNYGGHGTTIEAQYNAPGQYSTAPNGTDPCNKCIENAEWCLTYACSSVTSRSTSLPMSQSVMKQAGFCQCSGSCWWWIDTTGDGSRTPYVNDSTPYDTFLCE